MNPNQKYNEIVLSCVIGIVLSVVIIYFGTRSKTPHLKADDDCPKDAFNNTQHEKQLKINEAVFIKKSKKLQELFGVSEAQVHQAIQETNENISNKSIKNGNELNDYEFNWFGLLDTIVFVGFICCAFFAINSFSHGEFGRILLGMFPKEFESLKMTQYLEQQHIPTDTTPINET